MGFFDDWGDALARPFKQTFSSFQTLFTRPGKLNLGDVTRIALPGLGAAITSHADLVSGKSNAALYQDATLAAFAGYVDPTLAPKVAAGVQTLGGYASSGVASVGGFVKSIAGGISTALLALSQLKQKLPNVNVGGGGSGGGPDLGGLQDALRNAGDKLQGYLGQLGKAQPATSSAPPAGTPAQLPKWIPIAAVALLVAAVLFYLWRRRKK